MDVLLIALVLMTLMGLAATFTAWQESKSRRMLEVLQTRLPSLCIPCQETLSSAPVPTRTGPRKAASPPPRLQ